MENTRLIVKLKLQCLCGYPPAAGLQPPADHIREIVKRACRTISRFLYAALASHAAAIPLGRRSLPGSSDLPGSGNGASRSSSPIWSCSAWGLPCRHTLLRPRCALTAPFHPYRDRTPPKRDRHQAVLFSVALSVKLACERAPPAVSRHAALWRPDFPPAPPVSRRSQRLPVRQARIHYQGHSREPQASSV